MKSISSGVTVKNKPKLVGAAKCIPQAFNWLPVGPISILGPKRRGACCANAPPLATPPSPTTHHPWPTTVGVNFRKTSLTRPRRASRLYGCRHSNWIGCLLLGSFNRCPITIQEQPFSSGHRARTYGPGLSSTVVAWRNTPLSPKLTSSMAGLLSLRACPMGYYCSQLFCRRPRTRTIAVKPAVSWNFRSCWHFSPAAHLETSSLGARFETVTRNALCNARECLKFDEK